jgi:uncharacterized protein YndB with AHSA1/START domain
MPDYEATRSVAASPDEVYGYVANPSHLPEYIPHLTKAIAEGADLHVEADVEGRHEEGSAMFRPDAANRRIEWGGERAVPYSGWLQVQGSDGGSSVTIHLTVPDDRDKDMIQASIAEALSNIRDQVAKG